MNKREKNKELKFKVVLTNHPVLCAHEISKKAQRHIFKFLKLAAVLPAPSRLALNNLKTLKDLPVRSKVSVSSAK